MNARFRSIYVGALSGLKGLLFPPACAGCDMPRSLAPEIGPNDLCQTCRQDLRRIEPPMCDRCGRPYAGDFRNQDSEFSCANCADLDLKFDHAIASYLARSVAREMIHALKYGKQLHVLPTLGRLMRPALADPRINSHPEPWMLVPVPLHPKRERKRTFNQADLLMRELAAGAAFEFTSPLRRVRDTEHQANLGRDERLRNLKGAFALTKGKRARDAIKGRSILLIDDVLTTGTTASECAAVLKAAGAEKVIALTVLRG